MVRRLALRKPGERKERRKKGVKRVVGVVRPSRFAAWGGGNKEEEVFKRGRGYFLGGKGSVAQP